MRHVHGLGFVSSIALASVASTAACYTGLEPETGDAVERRADKRNNKSCGDGVCSRRENCDSCAQDCGTCPDPCGNEICDASEDCTSCASDCGACAPVCGDGVCSAGEDCASCATDCQACASTCDDGTCASSESCSSCAADCGACASICGDGTCDDREDCDSCASDCGTCPSLCGDGICDADEDCGSCADDCGPCPTTDYCADVTSWDATAVTFENEVLVAVNQRRAQGANCGSYGTFAPAAPVSLDPALRCAARKHSRNMAEQGFFSHTSPDGETPWDRMTAAGYVYSYAGENIAAGYASPMAVVDGWMNSDGHCRNIMNPNFQDLGVGYYRGGSYGHYWTQNFGRPW